MKRWLRLIVLVGCFMLACFSRVDAPLLAQTEEIFVSTGQQSYEKARILKQIIPSATLAVVLEDAALKAEASALSPIVATVRAGTMVEVLQDTSQKWYRVENSDEALCGWIAAKHLQIVPAAAPVPEKMTPEDITAFANLMRFPSGSSFFIWTDIARQQVHIFEKKDGAYHLLESFPCASGKAESPTTRGYFTITDRGPWFYAKRFDSGAKYWVRFNDTYLFHSVAMDKNEAVIDGVLGERRSSGCVRLSVDHAQWLYENIPAGTSVFIH